MRSRGTSPNLPRSKSANLVPPLSLGVRPPTHAIAHIHRPVNTNRLALSRLVPVRGTACSRLCQRSFVHAGRHGVVHTYVELSVAIILRRALSTLVVCPRCYLRTALFIQGQYTVNIRGGCGPNQALQVTSRNLQKQKRKLRAAPELRR